MTAGRELKELQSTSKHTSQVLGRRRINANERGKEGEEWATMGSKGVSVEASA